MTTLNKTMLLASALCAISALPARSAPLYTSTVFATASAAAAGASGPDSVSVGAGSVWVSYDGGSLSSDGSQPAGFSTVARYSPTGTLQATFQIGGDVDGLKYNPSTGQVWAMQNQDANSRLTLINPATNVAGPSMAYAVTSNHQGYDDVAFTPNGTFLSFTNPAAPTEATLQQVVPGTSPIQVTTIATAGTPGTNIVTGSSNYVLPTANTDSLKVAPNGDLVQTTGSRNTLAFIRNAGTSSQTISYLPLTASGASISGLDDSLYLTSSSGRIYASVTNSDQVVAIDYSGVTPGTLIGSIGSLNEIGFIDPLTGNVTPFVTGLSGVHGLALADTAVPEPASLALLAVGLISLAAIRRRQPTSTAV